MLKISLILSLLSFNAYADFSGVIIAYGSSDVPVNSTIDIDAEYVAMSVSLSSDARYPSERAKLISQLQTLISSATSQFSNINFQQGIVSLAPREKSSFSISSYYGRNSGSSFYRRAKLGDGKDVYSATQDIYAFLGRIQGPKDTGLSLANTSLAISSPGDYRNTLPEKIKAEIIATKEALGPACKASISSLENPVIVRQKNDRQVTLFIDYRIEFSE